MSIVFELGRPESSFVDDAGRSARAMLSWFSAVSRAVTATVVAVVGGLVLWSVLPAALGWDSHVVVSGSMQPRIMTGDIVLTERIEPTAIKPGYVVAFPDPANPGRQILHRVESIDEDGKLVTRGDANQSADSTHVDPSTVQGFGRLRVPYVGLPVFWQAHGETVRLAIFMTVLLGAVTFVVLDGVARSEDDEDGSEDGDEDSDDLAGVEPAVDSHDEDEIFLSDLFASDQYGAVLDSSSADDEFASSADHSPRA